MRTCLFVKLLLPKNTSSLHISAYVPYAFLLITILFFGLIRLRFLDFPLERDEGEYGYAAQLILKGLSPYALCYTMKLPGTAAIYALIMAIFGQSTVGIHLGLLLVNAATTVLMFILAKRLFGPVAGAAASACFEFLTIEPSLYGLSAHATHFVLLPLLAGILLLLKALEPLRLGMLFISGLLFGAAFLMKQPGIFFVFFAFFILIHNQYTTSNAWRKSVIAGSVFLLGVILPPLLTGMLFFLTGDFQQFWFWTVTYATTYGTNVSFSDGMCFLKANGISTMGPTALISECALIGSVFCFIGDISVRKHALFILAFFLFSCAAVCSSLYFRPHYFILLTPALSLSCGAFISSTAYKDTVEKRLPVGKRLPAFIIGVALLISIIQQREVLFRMDPLTLSRTLYDTNPFIEAPVIANFIKNHTDENDRIAILGSEPEILFYARRLSVTNYIYMYPLMEEQPFAAKMQKQVITDIEKARPKFIVLGDFTNSWLVSPRSDRTIINWLQKKLHDDYTIAGAAIISPNDTKYHWEEGAESYNPDIYEIAVFERKL